MVLFSYYQGDVIFQDFLRSWVGFGVVGGFVVSRMSIGIVLGILFGGMIFSFFLGFII